MPETGTLTTTKPPFHLDRTSADSPAFSQQALGNPLVYLANSCNTQKPPLVNEQVPPFGTEVCRPLRLACH